MALQETAATSGHVEILEKYDPELRFRQLTGITLKLVFFMTLVLSIFHIYTAGFGVFQEWRHRAFHLAFVLPLVYFLYSIRKGREQEVKHLVYDVIYGTVGASLVSTLFREIMDLTGYATLVLFAVSFLFIIYFKRRAFLSSRLFVYADFVIFTLMIGVLLFGAS
ncbi:MAG: hypothetical protein JRD89_10935, partial [Deltaproteobacteria bacterium]|nr:hypothetical protein [Deltaproteobacteria bacterium]